MKLLVGCRTCLFLFCLVTFYSCRKGEAPEPEIVSQEARQIINENLRDIRGTYAFPPLTSQQKVDVDKLISELKEMHANCYNWLIYTRHNEWEDLPNFLPKARAAGIKVWITVVPPSETIFPVFVSEPFRNDYIKWAEEIAKLSLEHDNLVAWSIDDFPSHQNLSLFTRAYVRKMRQTMYDINPKLAFIPCVYYEHSSPLFGEGYSNYFDGILYPYNAASTGKKNLQNYDALYKEIEFVKRSFRKDIPIIIDVYAGPLSFLKDTSTPAYIHNVVKIAMANTNGATIYCHRDAVKNRENFDAVKSGFLK